MADSPSSLLLDAYRLATSVAAPMADPLLAWRTRKGKEDPQRRAERHGIASLPRPDGPLVWVHAASVGETVSILPLVERMVASGRVAVLLTTGTTTSAGIAAARLPPGAVHQYVPLDSRRFIRRFLAHWRPGLALFAESELWPNMILETAASRASLALINARLSQRSFETWQRAPSMIRALLSHFDLCLAQSAEDAGRLASLGAAPVTCTGNLKFDVPAPTASHGELARLLKAIGGRPRWAAASIHAGEDGAILDAHAGLSARLPGLMTILAPRHPERGAAIEALARQRRLKVARRSQQGLPEPDSDLFVVDTVGELGLVYRVAPAAFIGGSLIAHGGQNPIEPAKLDTAILHGPNTANFAEIYAALDAAGGAEEVSGAQDLIRSVGRMLENPQAAKLRAEAAAVAVAGFGGALERTLAALDPLIARAIAAKG